MGEILTIVITAIKYEQEICLKPFYCNRTRYTTRPSRTSTPGAIDIVYKFVRETAVVVFVNTSVRDIRGHRLVANFGGLTSTQLLMTWRVKIA